MNSTFTLDDLIAAALQLKAEHGGALPVGILTDDPGYDRQRPWLKGVERLTFYRSLSTDEPYIAINEW